MENYAIRITLERKIERLKKRLEDYDIESPEKKYNYYGGWSIGYIIGRLSALEDTLDLLKE